MIITGTGRWKFSRFLLLNHSFMNRCLFFFYSFRMTQYRMIRINQGFNQILSTSWFSFIYMWRTPLVSRFHFLVNIESTLESRWRAPFLTVPYWLSSVQIVQQASFKFKSHKQISWLSVNKKPLASKNLWPDCIL